MSSRRTVARWALWLGLLIAVSLALIPLRAEIGQSPAVLVLMLVILGGSSGGDRWLGITLAVVSFIVIDYSFQPPYDELAVAKGLDWIVLLAFLAVALAATELLARARAEAELARLRAVEVERLAAHEEEARMLRAANSAKDEVLAAVSHDLRTPLATIKVLAQRARAADDHASTYIEEEVDRLARMVSDVLDLSRLRLGRMTLDVDINTADDLVGTAIRRVQGVLNGRIVRTQLDMNSPPLAGRFDLVHAARIVGNLIDNAIRFTPVGGVIDVVATREGEWLVVRVADRGPGVSESEVGRIFEPFYRPRGEAADAGHAGLGLSIARQLAELQGGSVAYAARDGGGSEFTLRLPAANWSEEVLPDD
jgi:K+-sensing histidine kinase KdpD